jgi:hypothetical protein
MDFHKMRDMPGGWRKSEKDRTFVRQNQQVFFSGVDLPGRAANGSPASAGE